MTTPTQPATDEEIEAMREAWSAEPVSWVNTHMIRLIARIDAERAARERAEVALDSVVEAMHGPTMQAPAERVRGYVETCDRLGTEKAEALAACAEMREALGHIRERAASSIGRDESDAIDICDAIERLVGSALGEGDPLTGECPRPDLGAGKVLVEREVLERVCERLRRSLPMLGPRHGEWSDDSKEAADLLADLDVLLKKGGG